MNKHHLLLLGTYPAVDMEILEREYQLHKLWEQKDPAAYLKNHAVEIRALATRGDLGVKKDVLELLPNLKVIANYGVGVDAIDFEACQAQGIKVCNTPDVLTEDVADLALALMLGIARHIAQADAYTRAGKWPAATYPLHTRMNTKRLGILGLGRIGMAIAKRAEGFSMPIAYYTRQPRDKAGYQYYGSPEELARNSDFLVAIVPGGAGTQNLVNAKVLKALGSSGYFINVSRGSVVDEPALLDALENKVIAGAGLDVYWNEPNINPRYLKLDNVVLHPHGGSATVETRAAMGKLVRDNLTAFFSGKPLLTPVN